MKKAGVTGGIGSGKTTFCKKLEELGAFVVYADDLAKELMVSDAELVLQLKEAFGEGVFLTDGLLNKKFLSNEAFRKGRVEELNDIVHPVLWERINELATQKETEGARVFVKEAAILLNKGRPNDLDYVILLRADESERIARTVLRDHSTPEKVLNRIQKQPNFERMGHLCDFVITNDSDLIELERKAEEVFELIK